MQEPNSSSPSRRMLEFVAGPDVDKIGMVCALPPKALLIRKLTPGGWAETQGVNLGDIMTEVNGLSASKLLAEDLKAAMLQRPLRFRLADPSCNSAALKIQRVERGRVARQEVATIRNTIGDGSAGDDATGSSAVPPATSPSHEHSANSPILPDEHSQEDAERSVPVMAAQLHCKPAERSSIRIDEQDSTTGPLRLDAASVVEDLSLEELKAQCRQSGIEPLPRASKIDLLSAIAHLQSPAPSSALSPSPAGSPVDEQPREASLQWPVALEDSNACALPHKGCSITVAEDAPAGFALYSGSAAVEEKEEAGGGSDGISKFLEDGGGGSAALAAALSAATKIQSVHRGREARKSLSRQRDATGRRGGRVVSGPESQGLAAALEATSSQSQRSNDTKDTMEPTPSETKADCRTRELAAQEIQRVYRGRQARKHVEETAAREAAASESAAKEAAAKEAAAKEADAKEAAAKEAAAKEAAAKEAAAKEAVAKEAAAKEAAAKEAAVIQAVAMEASAKEAAAREANMESPSPAASEADLEHAAVTLQRLRRAHVARRDLARMQAANRTQEVDEDQIAAVTVADDVDSVCDDEICSADDYDADICRVDVADADYNEDTSDEDIDDAERDPSDPHIDSDTEVVEGLNGYSDDENDNMLAGLEIFCAADEGHSAHVSPHVRAVPGADPHNFFQPADRGPFTPLEDKMRDLMDHVRMFQEEENPSPSRRRQSPCISPHLDASIREVSAPPLSRSRARDAESDEEEDVIFSARGEADHRGARGRACSSEPQEVRHWPSRRREISDEDFLRRLDNNDFAQPSEEAGPSRPRAAVPRARRFQLLCPDAPRATRGRSASGATALQEFKTMLLQREHGFVRAWRQILDVGGNGRLTLAELCEGCRRLGFRGNIRELWQQLDADGVGMITLCELDWDSAFALAKFHAALVMKYSKVKIAAKQLGLTGMRRFKHDEFCSLLQKHRLAPQHEAASLFKMLCTCPPASALDRDAGVSVREFDWLNMMSKHLPHVGTDRVEPGVLIDGAPDTHPADVSQNGFDDEGVYDEGELDKFDEGVGNVFNKLYQQAMELQERQKDREQSQNMPNQVGTHGPVDPHRFSRLYNDHRVKLEKMERNTEEFYRAQMPHADGPKQISDEVWERLVKPKDKGLEDEPVVVKSDGRTTSLDVLPMSAIRSACEQEGLESRGKTREEMLELLKLVAKEKEVRAPPVTQPQMTSRMEALYNDHKQRLQVQEERSRSKLEKEEQEIQDMQLGGGKRVDPAMYDRLYARAEEKEKRRQQEVEKKEAREIAQFAQPAKGPVKPEAFFRLYYDGVDRDVKRNVKKQMKELQEEVKLKQASIHKNKTRDPKWFERLYNKSNNNKKRSPDVHECEVPEPVAQERQQFAEPLPQGRQRLAGGPQGQLPDRSTSEELNRLLRAKEEAARRMAAGSMVKSQSESGFSEASPRGILKGNAGLGARDVTPPRREQLARSEDPQRKVTFGSRVSVLEPPCEIELRSAEVGLARDFAEYLFRRFPDSNAAFDAFDIYRTGQVGLTSFISGGKRIQFSGDIKSIFRALDVNRAGQISKSDFRVLMQFHPRVTAQIESSEPLMRSSASAPHFMVRSSAVPAGRQQQSPQQTVHRVKSERADRAPKIKPETTSNSPQLRCNANLLQVSPPCPGESNVCPQDVLDQQRILASAYPYKGRGATISSFASKEAPPSKMQQPKVRAEKGRSDVTGRVADGEDLLMASRCAMAAATAMMESTGSQCMGATAEEGRYPYKGRVETTPGLATPTSAGAPSTPESRPRNGGNSHQLAILRARSQEWDQSAVRTRGGVEQPYEVPLDCNEEFLQIDSAGKRGPADEYDSDTAVPSASLHSRDCSTPPSPHSSTPPSPRQSVTAPQSTTRSAVNTSPVASKLGQAAPRSSLAAHRMQRNRNAVVCKDGVVAGQQFEATAPQLSRKTTGTQQRPAASGRCDKVPVDADSTSHLYVKRRDSKDSSEDAETEQLQDEVMRLLLEYKQDETDLSTASQERPSQEGAELSSESAWIHHRDSTVA